MTKTNHWIIAPHPDDELIGCFTALEAGQVTGVAYFDFGSDVRRAEAAGVCNFYSIELINLEASLTNLLAFVEKIEQDMVFLPSPQDEHHLHKTIFHLAISERRKGVKPTGIYSVYMNDWFVKECTQPELKRTRLDFHYPSQKSLWKSNHKFFLFEGMAIT